jgi:hypothetical protein
MAALVAVAPVFDPETGRTHMPGDAFEIDGGRAARLVAAGLAVENPVAPARAEPKMEAGGDSGEAAGSDPLSALYEGKTKAQLSEMAAARGIEVPAKATKAEIIALLGAAR